MHAGQEGGADLVSYLLPDLLALGLHARVLGLALLLLLPKCLLPLLFLLLCVGVLLLLPAQHLPHVLGGPCGGRVGEEEGGVMAARLA